MRSYGRLARSGPQGKKIDELAHPGIPAGLPSTLLERRPDIKKAEQDLIAANAQIGAARAQYFPKITITGHVGLCERAAVGLFLVARARGLSPPTSPVPF
jgi:multidrug efflux system outer membrane protein